MDERFYDEHSLAEEFAAKDGGIAQILHSFVESAPWIVASIVLHLVIFAGLALMTLGGAEKLSAVTLESVFDQTETPEPTLEETIEDDKEELPPEEDDENLIDDDFTDDIEDEDVELDGDPDAPADQPYTDDTIGAIGLGPGSPTGAYGPRRGNRRKGGDPKRGPTGISEASVNAGLQWLADHQEPDGHWDTKKWGGYGPYDPGICGLALLAFAGAGNTERSGRYRRVVQKSIKWLQEHQDASGNFAPGETMYNHAIPTLALLEEAAMAPSARTKAIAKKGLAYMLDAQNDYKAWRYWPNDNDNDTSVTTWCIMALKAAKVAKFDVPNEAWAGATKFLDEVTETNYGEVGYTSRPIKGAASSEYQKYSMTACGLLCRLYLGVSREDRLIRSGVEILMQNLPEWNQPGIGAPFFYYWYYGSLVLFQIEGEKWEKWNIKMRDMLVKHQITEKGELEGSWDPPVSHNFGQVGGRVYSTAMAVLTLEVYYRYEVIAKKNSK